MCGSYLMQKDELGNSLLSLSMALITCLCENTVPGIAEGNDIRQGLLIKKDNFGLNSENTSTSMKDFFTFGTVPSNSEFLGICAEFRGI